MSPSRSRRSSSGSSILKPAKPHQPLQNLNAYNLSNENSPTTTTKFKRRVSFAEKKHVKEFCNSVEQGTVWDTTYEEHDLSHLKIPGTVNQEEHDVQIVHEENILNCDQKNNMQFVCNEMIETDLNVKGSDLSSANAIGGIENKNFLLSQTQMLINSSSIKSHNVQTQNNKPPENNNHVFKTTVACRRCNEESCDSNFNSNNLNVTFIEDIDVECTEVVCPTISHDTNYGKNNEVEETFQNTSMDLTEPIVSSINVLHNFQQQQNIEKFNSQYRLNKSNVTIPGQNTSMEFTVAVPSIIKATNNIDKANSLIYSASNRTKRFDDISMEITTPVPSVPQSAANNEIETCDSDLTTCIRNKTTIFHDASMEITSAVKTKADKDINYQSDDFDRLISTEETDFQYGTEKTKLLNISMEMTKAIPNNIRSIIKNQERKEKNCDTTDVSVENNLIKIRSDVDYCKTLISLDKTKIYDTEAMEFTEAVTTSSQKNLTDNVPLQNSDDNDVKDGGVNLISDKTISQNSSMIITKVISPSSLKNNCEKITEDYESNKNNQELNKTVFCPHMSMEMTEPAIVSQYHVPVKNPVINSTYVKESVLAKVHENKSKDSLNYTNISNNVLEDITSIVVPSSSKSELILDKEMQVADDLPQCSKENATKTPVLPEVENFVNSSSNIMLLESAQQDSDASKGNSKEKTYVLLSPLLSNPPNVTTSEINQNECSSHKQSPNVMANPRRTYAIHPLTGHHDNINNETNNDTFCNASNDKINCTNSNLNLIDNLQNDDKECSLEQDAIFFNNTLEELYTITPPSFVYLTDLPDSDTSVDNHIEVISNSDNNKSSEITEQENIPENKCDLENVHDAHESTLKTDQVDLRPTLEFHDSSEQKDASIELDPFSSLMNKLKVCSESDEIIWEVYHENIERNLFVIGFISSSLLVVIYLNDHCDATGDRLVKEIKIHSRLADDADALISIVHRIIIEKLDSQALMDLCKNCEDIYSMLDYISKEVKLAMDFMFDVERICDINLMEITRESISFVAFARKKDIILRVTVAIKPFHKIKSEDISVDCTLGSVSEEFVKRLITNIKRDHKFLRRYINDVNEYIYLMELC